MIVRNVASRMVWLSALMLVVGLCHAASAGQQTESFDVDPGWDGFRNRLLPTPLPVVKQDFGYQSSKLAGGIKSGEIGGVIRRASRPAHYAKVIEPRTMNLPLTASGKVAVTDSPGDGGMLLGWFNATASPGTRFVLNSLFFSIDGSHKTYQIHYGYTTRNMLFGGGGAFEGKIWQTTPTPPYKADGTPHDWQLSYDPGHADGEGTLTLQVDERVYSIPVPRAHKLDGAEFNRFGMLSPRIPGGTLSVFVDDLAIEGESQNFDTDPGWEGAGNREQYEERLIRPRHDIGFSATNFAGGKPGELAGVVWRDPEPAYYGAPVGRLTLNDELRASGKLAFTNAASDSAVMIGWFNSEAKRNKTLPDSQTRQTHYLAIMIEGPTRDGHYFRPSYGTASGAGGHKETGPILRPSTAVHNWSMHYRPDGAGGNGRIEFALDGETQTFDLQPGHKAEGAKFDRFGIFNGQEGGHFVEFYLDDLEYTSQSEAPGSAEN